MTDHDIIERDENRLWRIEELQRKIERLLNEQFEQRNERQSFRDSREVTVSPEAHNPENTRLEVVDVVGQLADISDLRQELADKAEELGGDAVCEMTVTPVGDGQVLVSGLATKSAELVENDRQEEVYMEWSQQAIANTREDLKELEELLEESVARRYQR